MKANAGLNEVSTPSGVRTWHAEFLEDLSRLFHQHVQELVIEHCGSENGNMMARYRHRLLEPVLFTLNCRRNFFRTGFSLAMGKFVGNFEVGRVAAFAGEIAWTCALLADDILDHSEEREGHTCAHHIYGKHRTVIAVFIGLWIAFCSLLVKRGVPGRARVSMSWFSMHLLVRCAASQVHAVRSIRTLKAFSRHAMDVNNSTHWALLAPLMGFVDDEVISIVRTYADAISINGKMRNDLLDYCGGSTESVTMFRDFHGRKMTFPTLVLWDQQLDGNDRTKIKNHFIEKADTSALTSDELIGLFKKYRTFERCLKLMRDQVALARDAIMMLVITANPPDEVTEMLFRWTQHQIELAEQRVKLSQESST